jgi:hypothetical protein
MRHAWTGVILSGVLLAAVVAGAAPSAWNPGAWTKESTIELRTTCPGEGEHWFPVWLVVLDGDVYVRLGTRAAGRVECNQTKPDVGVRIAGLAFDRVRLEPAPAAVERVAAAMGAKYWSDVVIHWMSHPLTARLVPE